MKVYAHFFENDNIQYRWRTLLQFGNSWEVIGSVVMKNPGSSKPISEVSDEQILAELNKFDNTEKWKEFSIDNTMQCIENLFKEHQKINKDTEKLNGVIQIFNLFNIREADLGKALQLSQNFEKGKFYQTTQQDLENLKAPIYLGWGGLGNDKKFYEQAQEYFKKAQDLHQDYLHDNFENNLFYHPQYLMGRGKYKGKSIYLKSCFFENTTQPTNVENIVFPKKLDKEIIFNGVVKSLESTAVATEIKEKVFRISVTNFQELQITISNTENGYVAIRHKNFEGRKKYNNGIYSNESQLIDFLIEEYNYSQSDVWLGKKNFSEYDGSNEEEIIENIITELNELQQVLQEIK